MTARKAQAEKPRPGTVQARGRARRAAVLVAARDLFAQQGFKRTSLMAVAKAAKMTDAGLLYHFTTKADLLLAVIEQGDQNERIQLNEIAEAGGISALRALADWGQFLENEPVLTALDVTLSAEYLQEDSQVRRYFAARYERIRKIVGGFFRAAQAAGDLSAAAQPDLEAQLLIATLDGLRLQWLLSDRKVSMAHAMRAYVDGTLARLAP